jgi:hypothetical protein
MVGYVTIWEKSQCNQRDRASIYLRSHVGFPARTRSRKFAVKDAKELNKKEREIYRDVEKRKKI